MSYTTKMMMILMIFLMMVMMNQFNISDNCDIGRTFFIIITKHVVFLRLILFAERAVLL